MFFSLHLRRHYLQAILPHLSGDEAASMVHTRTTLAPGLLFFMGLYRNCPFKFTAELYGGYSYYGKQEISFYSC